MGLDASKYDYIAAAILVEGQLSRFVCSLSSLLAQEYESWYVLDERLFPPHITLWLAHVPHSCLQELSSHFSELVSKFDAFEFNLSPPDIDASGFAHIGVHSEDARQIHTQMLEEFNPYRGGYIPLKYRQRWAAMSEEERLSVERYGTRFAGALYRPHISLGFVQNGKQISTRDLWLWDRPEVETAQTLILFRQVERGRSVELLERNSLRVAIY